MRILAAFALFAAPVFGLAQDFKVTLEAYSKAVPSRTISNRSVMAPSEGLRVLVAHTKVVQDPSPELTAGIKDLTDLAQLTKVATDTLIAELKKPGSDPISDDTIKAVGTSIRKIRAFLNKESATPAGHLSILARDFRTRFNLKARRIVIDINRVSDANVLMGKLPLDGNVPLLVAVNETLDEIIAEAINSVQREGVFLKVTIDLYRNHDLSRIPDTNFLAPANKASLDALLALRKQLRGLQGGDGNQPIDPSNLGKLLIAKFKSDYKLMADKIQADLKYRVDDINAKAQEILNKIQNPDIKKSYEVEKDKLTSLTDRFQLIIDTAKKLSKGIDETDASGKPQDDAALLNLWSTQLSSLQSNSISLIADTKLFASELTTWSNGVGAAIEAEAKQRVEEIKVLFADAQKSLNEFVSSALDSVQQVVKSQIEFLNLVNRLDKIESQTVEGTDGRVELDNEGLHLKGMTSTLASYDEIVVTVKERLSKDDEYKPVGEEKGYRIGIFKNDRWDQLYSLTFSPRIGNSNRWQDSLTYGQVFKKAFYSKSIQYNSWFPGIGWSMSVLDQNADSVRELGIASMFSFFDDRLVTGYGYNFSERHWYPYVGYRFRL